ncbi:MAG: methyltransferase domain-containing protein [Phycisphaerae bacterium]|nr:methyltransferase domain-containing protein [Phycisphaerae bacterium]
MRKSQRIRQHYQPRIDTGRENYDVLDWSSAEAQQARFAVLVDNVPLDGRTLLDVGCGLGDLWAYLKGRAISVDYCGVDLLPEMTASAAAGNPDARFVCGDIFDPDGCAMGIGGNFDVVFCSGMLNLDLGNNAKFLPKALRRMLELSQEHMVVNLLHSRSKMRYQHCAYYDPEIVMKILEPMGCQLRLIDDYLPNDFTVICGTIGF